MAEITTTQSFSDGDTVTATKLNNIQGNASIQPEAITNRTAETTIDQANDLLLMYDASATSLKKITPSNLIKAGTASDFPVTGNATIGGTLGVTGASTLTGNATIGGNLSVTGNSVVKAGTAASPAIQPTGDTNTGIFFPAADTIAFSEGGAEAMRIDSSGNVGIGISSPTSPLHVYNSANSGKLINIQNPNAGTGAYAGFDALSDTVSLSVRPYGSTFNTFTHAGIALAGAAEIWADTISGSGPQALLIGIKTAKPLIFATSDTERLRIDSSGNVGIGTTSPAAKLHIVKTISQTDIDTADQIINLVNTATDTSGNLSGIRLRQENGTNTANSFIGLSSTGNSATRANLIIATPNTSGNSTERLRITSGGVVRIGTATELLSSANRLEVSGVAGIGIQATGGAANLCMLAWNSAASGDNTFIGFYTEASPSLVGSIDFNRASTLTRYNTTSDATLKNIIGDSSGEESVSILKNTKIRDYTWKKDATNKVNVGVVAQELYEVFKGAVSVGGDIVSKDIDGNDITTYRPWGVDKTAFTFHLVAGWKAHEKLIQELKTENDSLKSRIEALEAA